MLHGSVVLPDVAEAIELEEVLSWCMQQHHKKQTVIIEPDSLLLIQGVRYRQAVALSRILR